MRRNLHLSCCWLRRWHRHTDIRRIKIVLTCNTDQREQGIASGIGERGAHAVRMGNVRNRTDRPLRGNPFAGSMSEHGGQLDHSRGLIHARRLNDRNLLLAERLANDFESAGKGA